MSKVLSAALIFITAPSLLFAAETPTSFKSLVELLVGLINNVIYLIFALSILVFMWGIISAWILNAGDPDKVAQGRKFVLISIITLVVMTSLWGIVNVLRSTFFGS